MSLELSPGDPLTMRGAKGVAPRRKDGTSIAARPLDLRFWKKVTALGPDECWMWHGAKDRKGYGSIGHNGVVIGAHVASWTIHFGDPQGKWVLHKCDVPGCVNPDHLFLGSQLENIQDRVQKSRSATKEKGNWLGGKSRSEWKAQHANH